MAKHMEKILKDCQRLEALSNLAGGPDEQTAITIFEQLCYQLTAILQCIGNGVPLEDDVRHRVKNCLHCIGNLLWRQSGNASLDRHVNIIPQIFKIYQHILSLGSGDGDDRLTLVFLSAMLHRMDMEKGVIRTLIETGFVNSWIQSGTYLFKLHSGLLCVINIETGLLIPTEEAIKHLRYLWPIVASRKVPRDLKMDEKLGIFTYPQSYSSICGNLMPDHMLANVTGKILESEALHTDVKSRTRLDKLMKTVYKEIGKVIKSRDCHPLWSDIHCFLKFLKVDHIRVHIEWCISLWEICLNRKLHRCIDPPSDNIWSGLEVVIKTVLKDNVGILSEPDVSSHPVEEKLVLLPSPTPEFVADLHSLLDACTTTTIPEMVFRLMEDHQRQYICSQRCNGQTLLFKAVEVCQHQFLKTIIPFSSKVVDERCTNVVGTTCCSMVTPLWWACQRGCAECVRIILHSGATILRATFTPDLPSALHMAVTSDSVLQVMLDEIPKMSEEERKILLVTDSTGQTPVHYALNRSYFNQDGFNDASVELLLQIGVPVNVKDKWGKTPLHMLRDNVIPSNRHHWPNYGYRSAYSWGSMLYGHQREDRYHARRKTANIMVEYGAHLDAQDNTGTMAWKTLLDLNIEYNDTEIVSLKCLAARVVRVTNIPFINFVPKVIADFINLH